MSRLRASGEIAASDAPVQRIALFDLGFRPFFACACAWGPLAILAWVGAYRGWWPLDPRSAPMDWHAHEMVFGYAAAVLAGFLLTAAANWSALPTARGTALAALVGLWLAGRVAPFTGDAIPGAVAAAIDVAFLPVLAVAVAIPLVRARKLANLALCVPLLVLAAVNACLHADALGAWDGAARVAGPLAVYLVVLMVVIIGGRVLPFFAGRAIAGAAPVVRKPIEILSIATLVGLALADVAGLDAWTIGLGVAATATHAIRLAGWWVRGIGARPMLWVLFLAYVWIVAGCALAAAGAAGLAPPALGLHALAVGGIGAMTVGMMTRVSLGHTGRAIEATPAIVAAFVLVHVAAAARVLIPLAAPHRYVDAVALSGVAFAASLAITLAVLAPMLWAPRIDE